MVPESRSYAPSWGFPISKGEIFGVYAPLDFHISWLRRGLVLASPSHPPIASRSSFLLQEGNKSCSERAEGACSATFVFFHTSLFWIREVIHCWRFLSLICYQLGPVQSLLSPTANGGSALQTRLTKSYFVAEAIRQKTEVKKGFQDCLLCKLAVVIYAENLNGTWISDFSTLLYMYMW